MENDFNLSYIGKLYMGRNKEYVDIIYDTGSDWLIVEGHTCSTCTGNVYNWADENGDTLFFKP